MFQRCSARTPETRSRIPWRLKARRSAPFYILLWRAQMRSKPQVPIRRADKDDSSPAMMNTLAERKVAVTRNRVTSWSAGSDQLLTPDATATGTPLGQNHLRSDSAGQSKIELEVIKVKKIKYSFSYPKRRPFMAPGGSRFLGKRHCWHWWKDNYPTWIRSCPERVRRVLGQRFWTRRKPELSCN